MKIVESILEEKIVLEVEGRVDTTTSPQLQQSILLALQKMKTLEINFEHVQYVSSAGLRALLMGHKTALSKSGDMILKKVPDIVMDVFAMTGFDKVLHIA